MKSIGVIGHGFVGTAVDEGMQHAFKVEVYDKAKGFRAGKQFSVLDNPYERIVKYTDGPIFVCVPTPMQSSGACDTSIVEDVVLTLNEVALKLDQTRTVVIKSTVVPGTTDSLNERCPHLHVCFNPEFLREASSVEDFKNQDRIIIGGPHAGTKVLKEMYQKSFPDVPTTKTHSTIAEMVKYVTNCFLATKVSFANEIKQVCDALDIDYDKVVEYATKDDRLGSSHWAVPGPDGFVGFGGKCFCKDLNALMFKSNELGVAVDTMKGAWSKNLEVRPEKDWESIDGVIS